MWKSNSHRSAAAAGESSVRTFSQLTVIYLLSMPRTILALVYIVYRIWVTLASGQIWLACDLWQVAVQVSAIVCAAKYNCSVCRCCCCCPHTATETEAEAVRLVIQKPNCGFAAWLSALLSTPLGRCCCCPCRASVCEWKWTNHWWASASGRELVYLSECVQVIQSSFCRWRDQLVAAALSLPRVRAPWLFLCVSLCVCVSAACNSCVNVNRSTSLLCAVQSSLLQSFICGCRNAKAERYVNVNKISKTSDKIKQFWIAVGNCYARTSLKNPADRQNQQQQQQRRRQRWSHPFPALCFVFLLLLTVVFDYCTCSTFNVFMNEISKVPQCVCVCVCAGVCPAVSTTTDNAALLLPTLDAIPVSFSGQCITP